uniref:Uncharacterized protein n=1 Tax=Manihot esculenta TaxID=3983 RepID=A0A2C9VN16_MANES
MKFFQIGPKSSIGLRFLFSGSKVSKWALCFFLYILRSYSFVV